MTPEALGIDGKKWSEISFGGNNSVRIYFGEAIRAGEFGDSSESV
jgi:hypothetical protein